MYLASKVLAFWTDRLVTAAFVKIYPYASFQADAKTRL